jgi:hypothetical protein
VALLDEYLLEPLIRCYADLVERLKLGGNAVFFSLSSKPVLAHEVLSLGETFPKAEDAFRQCEPLCLCIAGNARRGWLGQEKV